MIYQKYYKLNNIEKERESKREKIIVKLVDTNYSLLYLIVIYLIIKTKYKSKKKKNLN